MTSWLILGATSGIAKPLVREFADRGYRLFLTAREESSEELRRLAHDLEVRYDVEVQTGIFEALDFPSYGTFILEVEKKFGMIDGVVWMIGRMHPQEELQYDGEQARLQHDTNYTAAMSILSTISETMEKRRSGHIVAIGSPAGDRGRRSNYFYGADKAALPTFLEGLRHRLSRSGVKVLTVKPGPTRTPLTDGVRNLPLVTEPEIVAKDIIQAIERGKEVIYTPRIWQLIMLVIRHLPGWIFKRAKL
ncbi:MAG: SDR family NAD(P)-dependent oxidoreductase [Calditrichaeota bacterium]|nr:SDR family NAD(P)-dependent oxidoreductase [Calditrichota bacterium]